MHPHKPGKSTLLPMPASRAEGDAAKPLLFGVENSSPVLVATPVFAFATRLRFGMEGPMVENFISRSFIADQFGLVSSLIEFLSQTERAHNQAAASLSRPRTRVIASDDVVSIGVTGVVLSWL